MKTPLALLALVSLLVCGCDTTQVAAAQKKIADFNASPTGQRIGQDAEVAAAAAAAGAEQETMSELQANGKVDASAIGATAGANAVSALIQLDLQRAAAKSPGK